MSLKHESLCLLNKPLYLLIMDHRVLTQAIMSIKHELSCPLIMYHHVSYVQIIVFIRE